MFLHIAEGLILSILISLLAGESFTLSFIFFGVSAALILDLDFFVSWIKSGCKINKDILNHRELFHKPLLIALIGAAGFYYLWGFGFAFLWFLNIVMHGINDEFSDDLGGVLWLWPITKKGWLSKRVDAPIRLRQLEEECSINGKTAREFLIFLAALELSLLRLFV